MQQIELPWLEPAAFAPPLSVSAAADARFAIARDPLIDISLMSERDGGGTARRGGLERPVPRTAGIPTDCWWPGVAARARPNAEP